MPAAEFVAGPDLVERITVECEGDDRFVGTCGLGPARHVFGGQTLAQALHAAGHTVSSECRVRSLHAYFLRPAVLADPVHYRVRRLHDGRSVAVRSVSAVQNGREVLNLSVSFQAEEPSIDDQSPAPSAQRPELLAPALLAPVEVRPLDWRAPAGKRMQRQRLWLRSSTTLPDDPLIHAVAWTFASDLTLGWSPWKAVGVHRVTNGMVGVSLDHALWFHRDFRFDDWVLLDQRSHAVSASRGLTGARLFDGDGQLLASAKQEGMMRGIPALGSGWDAEPSGGDYADAGSERTAYGLY